MGSHPWLRTASGVGFAVLMLGSVSAYAGDMDGIKGHIDIPEIARIPGAPGIPDQHQNFAGILGDDWEQGLDGLLVGNVPSDERTPSLPEPAGRLDGLVNQVSVSDLIHTGPVFLRGEPTLVVDLPVSAVPVPGGVVTVLLGLGFMARRRR